MGRDGPSTESGQFLHSHHRLGTANSYDIEQSQLPQKRKRLRNESLMFSRIISLFSRIKIFIHNCSRPRKLLELFTFTFFFFFLFFSLKLNVRIKLDWFRFEEIIDKLDLDCEMFVGKTEITIEVFSVFLGTWLRLLSSLIKLCKNLKKVLRKF